MRSKGLNIVAAPVAASVVSAILLFAVLQNNETADRWVSHTFEVKEQTRELLTLVVDGETGMRGYILTKDKAFREPYDRAVAQIPPACTRLQLLVSDNPTQEARAKILTALCQHRLDLANDAGAVSNAGSSIQLRHALDLGNSAMNETRALISQFLAEEDRLLEIRQRHLDELNHNTKLIVAFSALFGVGVGILSAILFTRGIVSRVERIVEETEALKREELLTTPHVGNDEIGRLGRALSEACHLLAHRREEMIRARDTAESANRAKSDFLANVSHEIRTPLNGIIGLTDLTLDTALTSTQRDHLDMVKHSADALLALVNDLLDQAKIGAGKLALESAPFDLHELLEKNKRLLAMRASGKGLALNCHIAPDVPRLVSGDALRLRQILMNLVENATKFTAQGKIDIDVRNTDLSGAEVGLLFSVSDSGIGIPADKQEMIFQAFAQGDSSTTREYGGTGLGLAICSQLIELMGGRIWLESEPGLGSTFYFTAGFGAASTLAVQTMIQPAAANQSLVSLRILVADDNPVNQTVAAGILQKLGHRISLASNGREAVTAAREQKFDLVLMDVQMPELDGLAATARIREAEAGTARRTPIAAMTAHAGDGDRERCLAAGMDDYVSKPISKEKLMDVIGRIPGESAPGPGNDVATTSQQEAFNCESLLKNFDGDRELLARVSAIFRETAPALLQQLKEAVAVEDLAETARVAHTLRGAMGNIGADFGANLAGKIEESAAKKSSAHLGDRLADLNHGLDTILTELERFGQADAQSVA